MSDSEKAAWIGFVGVIVSAVITVKCQNDKVEVSTSKNEQLISENEGLANENRRLKTKVDSFNSVRKGIEKLQIEEMSLTRGSKVSVWLFNDEKIERLPLTPPLEVALDSGSAFSFDSYRLLGSKSSLVRKPLTIHWQGLISLKQKGDFVFITEALMNDIKNGGGFGYNIFYQIKIGNTVLVEDILEGVRDGNDPAVKQSSILLNPGLYNFEVWMSVNWVKYAAYWPEYNLDPTAINLRIKYRSTGDNLLQTLSPNNLLQR